MFGVTFSSNQPTPEEEARQEAAKKLQAVQRGINQRRRSWADQQLTKQGLDPIAVPTAEGQGYPLYCMCVSRGASSGPLQFAAPCSPPDCDPWFEQPC